MQAPMARKGSTFLKGDADSWVSRSIGQGSMGLVDCGKGNPQSPLLLLSSGQLALGAEHSG